MMHVCEEGMNRKKFRTEALIVVGGVLMPTTEGGDEQLPENGNEFHLIHNAATVLME